jgi:hypothetical protein
MERCDGWMDGWLLMAGALWWSPAVWSANEGLGLTADCATPINLARSAGFFWGAGAEKAFSGQQPKRVQSAVCDRAVNCLLSSLAVVLNKAWQVVRGRAECRRVLQCVAVASETREPRAMSFVYEVRTDLAVGGDSGGQEAHGRRGRSQKSGIPPLCSSSGGARVMTRLFSVVKPVKPWSESVAVRFKQRGRCCVSKPLRSDSLSSPASAGDG